MRSQPYPGTNRDIERIANGLRALIQNDFDKELGTRQLLTELVKRTNGVVVVVEDPSVQEAKGGSLVIRGERDYTIFLSPYTTPLRDNFTIGHELGHYVLHFFPQKRSPNCRWDSRDTVRAQSNGRRTDSRQPC